LSKIEVSGAAASRLAPAATRLACRRLFIGPSP
jgi:hypothetical protein